MRAAPASPGCACGGAPCWGGPPCGGPLCGCGGYCAGISIGCCEDGGACCALAPALIPRKIAPVRRTVPRLPREIFMADLRRSGPLMLTLVLDHCRAGAKPGRFSDLEY